MEFARKVWKLLVAIKDGLALLFLMLFFVALYAALSVRPGKGEIEKGALLIKLDGIVVEEPSAPDPLSLLFSAETPMHEYRARDIVRALRLAAKDDRIKAVVLDLSSFVGGGFVHLQDIGDALDEVRAAKKPVLTYAVAYVDDGMQLAAHADEVWIDPNGGAFITGPGGNRLYFGRLMQKLNIDVHIFRVGTYKSAVEPWILNGPSDASRKSFEDLYGALWEAWKADFAKARPKADIARVTSDPVAWLKSADGDVTQAGKAAGLIDRIGTRTDFGVRVTEIVGESRHKKGLGHYANTKLSTWLAANKENGKGKAIGVVTVAGEIVDGDAGPGVAGAERIVRLLNEGLDKDYSALVVRVDSPGGSLIASEHIRSAIDRYKAKDIPVVVSMANVAASGGYWVSTPAKRIFAEPGTITGSIGVYAILPTFDRALAEWGVTGGGVKTTPLTGQPDVFTGLAPEISPMIQSNIENSYRKFVGLVSKARGISADRAEDWAEGRPWAGGTARQLGLVDEFGGLDEALAYAAKLAKLEEGGWHAEYMGADENPLSSLLHRMGSAESAAVMEGRDLAGITAERQSALLRQVRRQAGRLFSARGTQAYCLECPQIPAPAGGESRDIGGLKQLARLIGASGVRGE